MYLTQKEYEDYLAAELREYAKQREADQYHEERAEYEVIHLAAGKTDSPVKAQREIMAPGEATRGPPGRKSTFETITKTIRMVMGVKGGNGQCPGPANTGPILKIFL